MVHGIPIQVVGFWVHTDHFDGLLEAPPTHLGTRLVKGVWKYLYRAVDKAGTVDFLLTAKRDMSAAKRFFDNAMEANGNPDKIVVDKSGANKAAIDAINAQRDVPIVVRQVKYLNNIVEQDHRAIERVTKPMPNFKSFHGARSVPFSPASRSCT